MAKRFLSQELFMWAMAVSSAKASPGQNGFIMVRVRDRKTVLRASGSAETLPKGDVGSSKRTLIYIFVG